MRSIQRRLGAVVAREWLPGDETFDGTCPNTTCQPAIL